MYTHTHIPGVRASHVGGFVGITVFRLHVETHVFVWICEGVTSTNKSTYMRSTYIRDF